MVSCLCFLIGYFILFLYLYIYLYICAKLKSLKEYEEKAVSLALNRPKLLDLTNRLKAARLTCPLFDTARWVRLQILIRLYNLVMIAVWN